MLYATEGVNSDDDFQKAMIGVASVWSVRSLVYLTILLSHDDRTGTKETRMSYKSLPPHIPDARLAGADVTAIYSVLVSV